MDSDFVSKISAGGAENGGFQAKRLGWDT